MVTRIEVSGGKQAMAIARIKGFPEDYPVRETVRLRRADDPDPDLLEALAQQRSLVEASDTRLLYDTLILRAFEAYAAGEPGRYRLRTEPLELTGTFDIAEAEIGADWTPQGTVVAAQVGRLAITGLSIETPGDAVIELLDDPAHYLLSGDDRVVGSGRRDRLSGEDGDDVVRGKGGADHLGGGQGDDLIFGGRGADRLLNAGGHDQMTGGRGADVFVMGRASGRSDVTDFEDGVDLISVSSRGWRLLDIKQRGDDTILRTEKTRFTLEDMAASDIDGADFLIA